MTSTADPLDTLRSALADRYAIERELGAGGMATVYLAEDVKHHRKVAIKVLHAELSAVLGPDRFLKEIELTANLQHPHILPLFDSGSAGGLLYYVMPYVDGETLRSRLERERQLPIADAVRIATESADALQYAHEHGVVHRDIKPENILLQNGHAVVADFGIALAVEQAGGARMTKTGLSLGTPQYMSPEQAMGERHIDARTDVYALGAVTYEMLTGEPPFTGPTAQGIVAKVMTERPSAPSAVRDTVPSNVDAAVLIALAKLPADRFSTAADLAAALHERSAIPGNRGERAHTNTSRAYRAVPWSVAALATLAALVMATAWLRAGHRPPATPVRFTVDPSAGERINVAEGGSTVAISPDGETVAYQAGANEQLYLRRLDQLGPVPVAGVHTAGDLHFSSDGRRIAFLKDGVVSAALVGEEAGGAPTKLADASTLDFAWTHSTDVVFVANDTLWRVAPDGARHIVAAADPHRNETWTTPFILPDGETVTFHVARAGPASAVAGAQIGMVSLGGGNVTRLQLQGANVIGYADGILLFGRADGRIMGVHFDMASRRVLGAPVVLVDGVRVKGEGAGVLAVMSDNGTLAYVSGTSASRIEVLDDHGALVDTVPGEQYHAAGPVWSPDGRRLAVAIDRNGSSDIWSYDFTTHVLSQLTQSGLASDPAWTPDGARIGFIQRLPSGSKPFSIPADGSGAAEEIQGTESIPDNAKQISFSPDGRYLLVELALTQPDASRVRAYAVPLSNTGGAASQPIPVLKGPAMFTPTVSPNGKWLAYTATAGNRLEVSVRSFPAGGGNVQISPDGGLEPQWSHNGRQLFYRIHSTFRVATLDLHGAMPRVVRTDSLFTSDAAEQLVNRSYDVQGDGKRFVVARDAGDGAKLIVVTNWLGEVRTKMRGQSHEVEHAR